MYYTHQISQIKLLEEFSMNHLLLIAFFCSLFITSGNGATPKVKTDDRELFAYDFALELKNPQEYLKLLCSDTDFNEIYKQLSTAEKKVLNEYCDKTIKLWTKVNQHQIDWDCFKKEATEILNPCIAVAEKFAQSKLYPFTIRVGSQYGSCCVCCHNKWPQGFGVVVSTEIELRGMPPRNKDAYIEFLLGYKEIAMVYENLTVDEQKEMHTFVEKLMVLYSRVAEGLLDLTTFQDEARAMLLPYKTIAEKFLAKGLSPFSAEVRLDSHGELKLIRVCFSKIHTPAGVKFEIVCTAKLIK